MLQSNLIFGLRTGEFFKNSTFPTSKMLEFFLKIRVFESCYIFGFKKEKLPDQKRLDCGYLNNIN